MDKNTGLKALVFLIDRVWVQVLIVVLVSFSKTLNHYCYILQMCRKVDVRRCEMHVKEPSALIDKRIPDKMIYRMLATATVLIIRKLTDCN